MPKRKYSLCSVIDMHDETIFHLLKHIKALSKVCILWNHDMKLAISGLKQVEQMARMSLLLSSVHAALLRRNVLNKNTKYMAFCVYQHHLYFPLKSREKLQIVTYPNSSTSVFHLSFYSFAIWFVQILIFQCAPQSLGPRQYCGSENNDRPGDDGTLRSV